MYTELITPGHSWTLYFAMKCDSGESRNLTGDRQETQTRLCYWDWGSGRVGSAAWNFLPEAVQVRHIERVKWSPGGLLS